MSSANNPSDFDINMVKKIKNEIFTDQILPVSYIFLCGGSGRTSIRNKVKHHIYSPNSEVLFPEDLFMDLLNRDKSGDLLTYENLLAINCDVICLICESMGSSAELGAFVQSDETRKKLLICMDKRYDRDRSFIRTGPVKFHIKQKGEVIWYSKNNIPGLAKQILAASAKQTHHNFVSASGKLVSLKEYVFFIVLLLWFYVAMSREKMFNILKEFRGNIDFSTFCALFNAAVNLLIRKQCINVCCDSVSKKYQSVISLTKKGEEMADSMLRNWRKKCSRSKSIRQLFDQATEGEATKNLPDMIRCDIMYMSLYSNPKP